MARIVKSNEGHFAASLASTKARALSGVAGGGAEGRRSKRGIVSLGRQCRGVLLTARHRLAATRTREPTRKEANDGYIKDPT